MLTLALWPSLSLSSAGWFPLVCSSACPSLLRSDQLSHILAQHGEQVLGRAIGWAFLQAAGEDAYYSPSVCCCLSCSASLRWRSWSRRSSCRRRLSSALRWASGSKL